MKQVISILKSLMRFKTTQDNPEEIKKCADYIIGYLRGNGLVIKKFIKNGKISIIASFRNSKKFQLILNAHFDVVPAPESFYKPKIKNGKIYGRGSDDCKGQVAILMHLMKRLSRQRNKPDVAIMLTSDEEIGGFDGVNYLLKSQKYKCDFAIVADGGDDWELVTKHKGVLQVKLSASGKTAHASQYWEGENAIEKLIQAYSKVQKIFPKLTKPAWKTTSNLSKICGGQTINQVPDHAEMFLDIRLIDADSEAKILKKLKQIMEVKVEKVFSANNHFTDVKDPYFIGLKASVQKILKRKTKTGYVSGATDARYFSERGMNAIIFKPLGFGPHSDEEHTAISSIEPYFKILLDFIENRIRHK